MSGDRGPVFVERRTYRRRRMADAARLLPVFGVVLVCIPLLWQGSDEGPTLTTDAMFYLFGLWGVLALISGVISRDLGEDDADGDNILDERPSGER